MFDPQNNWVVPLHKEVAQNRKPMHEERKFEDRRDPKQRKGRGGMTDHMTRTRPMIAHNRNRSVKTEGPLCSNSLSCRCDGLVSNKNRYHIGQPGVRQIKHASQAHCAHCENWHFRGKCSQDCVKLKKHSSDFEKWCKMRLCTSAFRSDQLAGYNWRHSDRQSVDKFPRASECESCCSRNDCRRDSIQNNEHTSNMQKRHKRRAQNPPHGSVGPDITNGPYGDGYWFNQFNHISYCEKCHSRNDCGQDSVEPHESFSDWSKRIAHNSGTQFINKNWHHSDRHWVNPFKHASYQKNWHLRNGHNKGGDKDPNHSSDCENGPKRNPHNPSGHTIWPIFNRKLNHKSHKNRQAVAQFKSDCENWRSGNDRNRDRVYHQKGSPDDKNWRSSKRDQVERCDRSPDHHEVTEHRVAISNREKKETEV